jgi:hypothetical protein
LGLRQKEELLREVALVTDRDTAIVVRDSKMSIILAISKGSALLMYLVV